MVELYDYTENEKEIVLLLEYCNDANYFEEKIENVSIFDESLRCNNFYEYYFLSVRQ